MNMPDARKKELQHNIRHLTKEIGRAKKANDFNEVENLRVRRGKFCKQLAEEFGEGYIIEDGKTVFKSLEEIHVHYEDPEKKKNVILADAANNVCQQRKYFKTRQLKLMGLTPEEVKDLVLKEIASSLTELETIANQIKKQLGEPVVDWTKVDEQQKEEDDFLKGIDPSSLM
jgi:hypothetical protein